MTKVELRNVNNHILRNVNLVINDGEFMVILGPNGAGKTTLLKVIAGFQKYDGHVLFDDEFIDDLPPHKRCIGYVPQSLALFIHMTVEENVAFGLKTQKLPRDVVKRRVENVLELLDLKHLRNRYPKTLSAGEQQKVALARALVINPKVLLMDEPFSYLQSDVRSQLRLELKRLQRALKITTIFVTHDLNEAEELADRATFLNNGRIVATGKFNEIMYRASHVLKELNILRCLVKNADSSGIAHVKCHGIELSILHENPLDVGDEVTLMIPPNKVVIFRTKPLTKINTYIGIINDVHNSRITISIGDLRIIAYNNQEFNLKPGDEIYVQFPLKHLKVLS